MLLINNQNNQNFGQINLIRVSKKAFENPENLKKCKIDFVNEMNKNRNNISCIKKIKNFINTSIGNKNKSETVLLGYLNNMPINTPLKNDYHSFAFFTGKECNIYLDLLNTYKEAASKDANKMISANNWIKNGEYLVPTYKEYIMQKTAIIMDTISKFHQNVFKNTNIKEFEINSLDELSSIASKLGL